MTCVFIAPFGRIPSPEGKVGRRTAARMRNGDILRKDCSYSASHLPIDYGNGAMVKYVYDDLGRVTQEAYYENGSSTVSRIVDYAYDSTGALVTASDSKTGRTTKCYYDTVGRVDRQRTTDGTASHNLYYTYDPLGQITQVRETFRANNNTATEEFITTYGYANGRVIAVCNDGGTEASSSDDAYAFYTYDNFDRVTGKSVGTGPNSNQNVMGETLTYNELDQVTSLVLDAAGFDRTYTYEYDGNGNINKIIWGGKTIEYFYDSQNQLIRENNPITQKTCVWKYDAAGNILSESEYAYTTSSYPTQGYSSFT